MTLETRQRLSLPWPVALVSLGVPLLVLGSIDLVYLTLGPGEEYTGMFRSDLIYYSANARELFDNGNGLFYGDPFSASASSPRVYSHLQLLILGWTWRLTGISLPILWQAAQVVFGVSMFLTLYVLTGCFFTGRTRTYAFLVAALGGGGAGIEALWAYFDGDTAGYLEVFRWLTYGGRGPGWLPNVFQNALFTTQVFYHTLAFATFTAVLRRRYGWGLAGVLAIWWSHPFTGIEIAAIVGAYAALESAIGRDPRVIRFAIGTALLSAGFLAYYLILLPLWSPEAAYLLERWTGFFSFRFEEAFAMWGVFLVAPLLLVFPATRPVSLRSQPGDRFLVVWVLVVVALLLHDRVLPDSMGSYQPLHYAHGYLFLPLAILTLRGLDRLSRGWSTRAKSVAATIFLLFVCIDNVLFTAKIATDRDRPVLEVGTPSLIHHLADQEPALVLVVPREPFPVPGMHLAPLQRWDYRPVAEIFNTFLSVATPHRTYLFSWLQTPFFEQKARAVVQIRKNPSPASRAAELGIGWLVVSDGKGSWLDPRISALQRDIEEGRARVALRSGGYALIEILSEGK